MMKFGLQLYLLKVRLLFSFDRERAALCYNKDQLQDPTCGPNLSSGAGPADYQPADRKEGQK